MESNVKALRDALLVVRDALTTISAHENDIGFVRTWIDLAGKTIDEALSTAPRNCDRQEITDGKSAHAAWLADKDNWDELGDPRQECHEWLLAPAKGETNES